MNKKNWILILSKESGNINKEQNNGLEAIGSIITEGDNEDLSPMDNTDEQNDDTTSLVNPEDDKTNDSPDGVNDTNSDITDTDDKNGDLNNDELNRDNLEDESNLDSNVRNDIKDPNYIQERRILLSNKILKLYDSIIDSINFIINSPSFKNKPVILNELTDLSSIVDTINKSINKESDHKVILLKYAMCVKTYNRIMESI